LVIAVAAFLPLHPEGLSFFDLFLIELSRGLLEGFLMLAGFGSPYLFGLAVLVSPLLSATSAPRVLRIPIALMHSQLLLVAIVIASAADAVAAWALLGFAIASGVYLAVHTARTHAAGPGPTAIWYLRWGGTVVAGVAAWSELQRLNEVVLGYGLHVLLAGALWVVWAGRPREPDTSLVSEAA